MTRYQYQKYLRSKHWLKFRNRYWNSKTTIKVCWVCGCPNGLQLHHQTYERIKHEKLGDVIAVCSDCHLKIHDYYNENKSKGISLWDAGVKVKEIHKEVEDACSKSQVALY